MESVPEDKQHATTPTKWWQWALVYPTLGVALISAVPTWVTLFQSYRLGVPFQKVDEAKDNERFFSDNFTCLQTAKFERVKNEFNIEVGAKVCPSGDIIIFTQAPTSKPRFKWIGFRSLNVSSQLQLLKPAYAQVPYYSERVQPIPVQFEVICQKWLQTGLLLQRVRYPNGCWDTVINTYTGVVVSQNPAPCMPQC
jgi:hypothetical protein